MPANRVSSQQEDMHTGSAARTSTMRMPMCPSEAMRVVRQIFNEHPNNRDLVATEMAPLFGLGRNANHDSLARIKAQCVFRYPGLEDPIGEFVILCLRGEWSLPLPQWDDTLRTTKAHRDDPAYLADRCPVAEGQSVERYYARYLIRVLHVFRHPVHRESQMLHWLRDASDEHVWWVFFHMLVYLQLEHMQLNKQKAPLRDLASHYINKVKGKTSYI
ncbi:hypothetical protein F5Y18DRAFT_443026 [Xylariaceae sp. FL1019]|nr:hypothetical protein F5Y18DRAFT_443026 [Xylariaceae sp. FL1019]